MQKVQKVQSKLFVKLFILTLIPLITTGIIMMYFNVWPNQYDACSEISRPGSTDKRKEIMARPQCDTGGPLGT